MMVSLPGQDGLNRLHLRQGRLPDPQAERELAVSESFAAAHGLAPGAELALVMNGRRMAFTVTGTAISPEFIYALGPGEMMPDPARFGIGWIPRAALAAAWDLDGAFSSLVLDLAPGASEVRVIERLDALLARYGGTGAVGRKDQMSHAFLDAELRQLGAMAKVLPPIFLAVAAMLVHVTLSRLVTLEREQIGLLKAIGYGRRAIAWHYVEFVLLIALGGIALGFAAGAWLGAGMARLYAEFFSFPYLVFSRNPAVYGLAALVALAAAAGGAVLAARPEGEPAGRRREGRCLARSHRPGAGLGHAACPGRSRRAACRLSLDGRAAGPSRRRAGLRRRLVSLRRRRDDPPPPPPCLRAARSSGNLKSEPRGWPHPAIPGTGPCPAPAPTEPRC
ncbi:ABC transporter permease [Mangrovicoccus ximenensis]|uniref:ABC transporter permease n=1 Tax=Mangrovicoccus ximenensis TaxID=1911570 RepID=UPI000D35F01D|nr:ABC transporter permease [Mangrovicoccus ximenensis]